MTSKGKPTPAMALDAAKKNMEDNLALLEEGVAELDGFINGDVEASEIQLEIIRTQYHTVVKLIEVYINNLRTAEDDDESRLQAHRRFDLIKNMAWLENHCKKMLATTQPSSSQHDVNRVSKLPKRELPKYDGDVRKWMAFWGAFSEIHQDKNLTDNEKLHYLLQSTVIGSPAYKVVTSFPATGANYQNAVDRLTERFGRKKTLIKVYMRDLLKVVVDNSCGEPEMDFIDLVTTIDSQIRNLAQLGVTQDKFGELLYPVVESCVPAQVLDNYLRTADYKEELGDLMDFLQKEVRRKLDTTLAQTQFNEDHSTKGVKLEKAAGVKSKGKWNNSSNNSKLPKTAASFVNTTSGNQKPTCVFCEKDNHRATDCRGAIRMSSEERQRKLKDKNACFTCFKTGHGSKKCLSKMVCMSCGGSHHIFMCRSGKASTPKEEKKSEDIPEATKEEACSSTSMCNLVSRPEVLLQTLTVMVHGTNGERKVRTAYDSLSHSTYIKSDVAEKLALERTGSEKVRHQTFGGKVSELQKHHLFRVTISGLHEKEKFTFEIPSVRKISGKIDRLPPGAYMEECKAIGVQLTDHEAESDEIELLLGADIGDLLKLGGKFMQLRHGPVVLHTKIGWIVSWRLESPGTVSNLAFMHLNDKEVSNYWALETIGINDPAETKCREEIERSALAHFNATIRQDDSGRYHVRLPFISGHPELKDNYAGAFRRLQTATKNLKKDGLLEDYDKVLKTWLSDNMIEVPSSPGPAACHYLPHRGVIKENSTTPLRPVFDASAKARNGASLNECLEKGPNLLELIPTILTRFRMDKVGVTADIKKAFQQMVVAEEDRDVMRFLWWEDVQECKKVVEYRHTRVVFGVTSSPFLLGATLQHHVKKFPKYKETKLLLSKCLYVDNAVLSLPSVEDADRFRKESCEILLAGQFDLRGWEFGPSHEKKTVPVLGLIWNVKEDTLKFDTKKLIENIGLPATKRNLYKLINQLYDPLGFAAPFLVVAKILLKKACGDKKLGWDEELTCDRALEFERWKRQFGDLDKVSLPRHIFASLEGAQLSLHVMCDASMDCFATCVYLRVTKCAEVKVFLVQAKTRVSPKKGVTIPRLELLACVIGARLAKTVLEDFGQIIPTYYWTDSTTALIWIQRQDSWATFVQNRVTQIREMSDRSRWAHIPGVLNPADLPSRGCSVKKLIESDWWSGPSWLYKAEETWNQAFPQPDEEEVSKERKKTVITAANLRGHVGHFEDVMLRSGNYQKGLRVIAHVTRFCNKLRKLPVEKGVIKLAEVEKAETTILKKIQATFEDSDLCKLPVVKDENGILRLKTRLIYGEDDEVFQMPAILPGKHAVVKLLILYEHEKYLHAGVQYLQNHLREKYWITNSRRTIRNIVHNCATCKRHLASRLNVPQPPLPAERIKTTKTFAVTGVDATGPLFVEKGKKVWVIIFTCAVYRAVHLELVESMSTEAFLGALQKFVARRGRPLTIFSDNGTNFVGASNFLRSVKWEDILEYANVKQIKWRFNPPTAAWWGGWWERLIGLMKNLMRRVLASRFIKKPQLEVLLVEVEFVMNDRPLTYVSEEPGDLRPLTPSCFLRDLPVAALPEMELGDGKAFRMNLNKLQKLKQELRVRFRKEYLGQLVCQANNKKTTPLQRGAVVLVEMDNQKRIDWPLGVVLETFVGNDGQTRVAHLKTTRGNMTRPVQKLFPVEVKSVDADIPREVLEAVPEQNEDLPEVEVSGFAP